LIVIENQENPMTASIETLYAQLAKDIQTHYELAKKPYDIPALPEAQCIAIPLIREAIAPILVRNNDADEITDMVLAGHNRVRIIASKTKGVERRRGAQILRALGMGGRAAANKAFVPKGKKPSDVFDLNSFVFGDSGTGHVSGKEFVFPIHAAALYSDAVSIQPKRNSVHSVFRQGGISEDGGNFDAEDKKSSSNIFTTYAVNPGTLFVQCLVLPGRRLTRAAFDHLLLSIGLTGAYGGATAVTGTNLRTHCAGIYWGRLERAINAPQEMLKAIGEAAEVETALATLEQAFTDAYPHHLGCGQTEKNVADLIDRFESNAPKLLAQYASAKEQVAQLFDAWFIGGSGKDAA
jgi:CRISPR-associated protein Csc2